MAARPKTKKAHLFGWFEVKESDLKLLKSLVSEVNIIRRKAEGIPAKAQGNHAMGDLLIGNCYESLKPIMEAKLSDGSTFKDCLLGKSSALNYSGLRLFFAGYPVISVMLARGDQTPSGFLLLETLAGAETAIFRPSPASPSLLMDNSRRYAIDGRSLAAERSQWPAELRQHWWKQCHLHDDYAEIELRKHYYLEKNNFCEYAAVIEAMKLERLLKLLRLKIYGDYLLFPSTEKRFASDPQIFHQALEFAFRDDVPADILAKRPQAISHKTHRAVERLVGEIEQTVRSTLELKLPVGGVLPQRSQLGILLGGWQRLPRPAPQPRLAEAEARSEKLFLEICDIFREDDPLKASKERKRRLPAIDVADLDHPNVFYRQMAIIQIQKEIYPDFIARSGLEKTYDSALKEIAACPMPYQGLGYLPIRLKAALTAGVIRDLGQQITLPEHFFSFEADPYMSESEVNALKSMHTELVTQCRRWMSFLRLHQKTPEVAGIFDAWSCFAEMNYRYMGHGVDSVKKLIVPAFFFSQPYFLALLDGEEDWYVQGWVRIRESIDYLARLILSHDWREVSKRFKVISVALKELHLQTIDREKPVAVDPGPPDEINFWEPPPGQIGPGAWTNEEDAAAPIQTVVSAPGEPARYQRMVQRNLPRINILKKLDSRPLQEVAHLAGYAKAGPLFDPQRLYLYQVGHCLFSTVTYPTEPVLGKKHLVYICFDFSGSMGEGRVRTAKDIAVILAEGLKERFDVVLSLYNNRGDFYLITQMFDSRQRAGLGKAGLSSLCREGLDAGTGWNPDAAVLLALRTQFRQRPDEPVILIHLSDHEYCKSLARSDCRHAQEEMEYAVNKLLDHGHRYIAARVGTDQDPFGDSEIMHEYIHFPERITLDKVVELYRVLCRTTESLVR